MKYALLILGFSPLSHYGFAQFEFDYDSVEKLNQRDMKDIDALYEVSRKGDFQLLFWTLQGQQDRRTLLVLTNENKKWQARNFERQKGMGRPVWKELPIFQEGIEILWKGLQENNVLHLKSSEDIKNFSFHPVDGGGVLYYFELLDKKGKRAYYYNCPKHQQQYNNHKEFSLIINMIQLINNFIQDTPKQIC